MPAVEEKKAMRRRGQVISKAPESAVQVLPLSVIRRDSTIQARAGLHESTVVEYVEVMNGRRRFPPVLVFHDGETFWLADGFHRIEAVERRHRDMIRAVVCDGTRRDAILAAAEANATPGLRRTNADKRRAVTLLLQDEDWSQWSDREIGRRCGVSSPFVGKLRAERSGTGVERTRRRRLVTRGGVTFQMNTEGIGRVPGEDPSPSVVEKDRVQEIEAAIAECIPEALPAWRQLSALGITLTPRGASLPANMPIEDLKRVGSLFTEIERFARDPEWQRAFNLFQDSHGTVTPDD